MRVHCASFRDVAVLTKAEGAAEAQRQIAASHPSQTGPFEAGLEGPRLLAEWIQSDVPLSIGDSERDCVLCEALRRTAAELERSAGGRPFIEVCTTSSDSCSGRMQPMRTFRIGGARPSGTRMTGDRS